MIRRGWPTGALVALAAVGGLIVLSRPSSAERAFYQAAQQCGVGESFISFVGAQNGNNGRLIEITYVTDGHSEDFVCVDRRLRNQGIRPKIEQEIDA